MKIGIAAVTMIALLVALPASLVAQHKEVTLKGTIMCAKCALKETKGCHTVIKVKENDKEVVYWLHDKGNKESYHEEVCGGDRKEGTVVGEVTERDHKKWITPKSVTYSK